MTESGPRHNDENENVGQLVHKEHDEDNTSRRDLASQVQKDQKDRLGDDHPRHSSLRTISDWTATNTARRTARKRRIKKSYSLVVLNDAKSSALCHLRDAVYQDAQRLT